MVCLFLCLHKQSVLEDSRSKRPPHSLPAWGIMAVLSFSLWVAAVPRRPHRRAPPPERFSAVFIDKLYCTLRTKTEHYRKLYENTVLKVHVPLFCYNIDFYKFLEIFFPEGSECLSPLLSAVRVCMLCSPERRAGAVPQACGRPRGPAWWSLPLRLASPRRCHLLPGVQGSGRLAAFGYVDARRKLQTAQRRVRRPGCCGVSAATGPSTAEVGAGSAPGPGRTASGRETASPGGSK